MSRDKKRIAIIIGVILVLGVVSLVILRPTGLSTVETTFGTVTYNLIDSGITETVNLQTTELPDGYFSYSIKSGADVRTVQATKISIEDAPRGTSFGYSLLYYYDNDSATNEMVFLEFQISAKDVRWDYVKVITGGGNLIKQIDIEPKTGTATFFVFVDETEISSWGSIFLQFVGWSYALNNVVAITGYVELAYTIGPPLETTPLEETIEREAAPLDLTILPIAFMILVLIQKQSKEE